MSRNDFIEMYNHDFEQFKGYDWERAIDVAYLSFIRGMNYQFNRECKDTKEAFNQLEQAS